MTNLRHIFQQQQRAFQQNRYPQAKQRIDQLNRLQQALLANNDTLLTAINQDYKNRSLFESRFAEIFPSIESIKYAKRHLKKWMKPQHRAVSKWFLPAYARVLTQPLGVVGIIVPWNYPVYLAISPLTYALAAGNRIMIKISEFTPNTGIALQQIIEKYFPHDEIAIINGDIEVAKMFSSLPFNHLLFTGSTSVGKQVMRSASEHLTPVTLELGGKSPTIIGPDANIKKASNKIWLGKLLNAGQTCIAPDYVLIPTAKQSTFIEEAKFWVKKHYPNLINNPDYSCIINEKQMHRLNTLIADAIKKGAAVIPIAPENKNNNHSEQKLQPSILVNITADMQVANEEIFGPILPIINYNNLDEAIAYINCRPNPLALYYFGHNKEDINKVIQNTLSGGVTINDTVLHAIQDTLPFGGVGASGMGQYHGREGFDTFSKKRSILYQRRVNLTTLFYPPYTKLTDKLLKWLLGV